MNTDPEEARRLDQHTLETDRHEAWTDEQAAKAERLWHESNLPSMLRYMAQRYGHPDPDVAVATTIIKMARSKNFHLGGPYVGYASTILRHVCVDTTRASWYTLECPVPIEEVSILAGASEDTDITENIAARGLQVAILSNIGQPTRNILIEFYIYQRTASEIAAMLDMPVGTVKTRIRRGLALARQIAKRKRLNLVS